MVALFCGKRLIVLKNHLFKIPRRNGYIVLVPEIGEDLLQTNPLLKDDKIPEFNKITIEKCTSAIVRQTVEFEEEIQKIDEKLKDSENVDIFNDVLHCIEKTYVPLEITWGIAKTMYFGNQSVMPTQSYIGIHERAKRALCTKFNSIPIYKSCVKAKNNKDLKLTDEETAILSKFILEGKLNGLDIIGKTFKHFTYSRNVTASKVNEFRDKMQITTKHFTHVIKNPEIVQDFPDKLLRICAADPSQPYVGPWTITLEPYVYKQFMEYCCDRKLRWKVWETYVTRGSLYQDRVLQTSTPLEEIRFRRTEQAEMLGYKSYAEMSMETKMAGSLENVYSILDTLLSIARPVQEKEINDLTDFAIQNGHEGNLKDWDLPYWIRRHKQATHKYQEDDIKHYFPLPKVLAGLFELTETLFNIQIVESRKADVWHEDVRFFDIFDLNNTDVEPIANFYLDPYARAKEKINYEQSLGHMLTIRNRSEICHTTPLAALIFNFESPVHGKPSLLTFGDVQILFQKFGHALHNLLTTTKYAEISGLSFVQWDAIQISDYFMSNWLFDPDILKQISGHYDTKKTLSPEMIEHLQNTRAYFAGYELCHELYLSRLDLELHSSKEFWLPIMKDLWKKHFVIPGEKKNSHVCSFESIFSGDWGAAYYSTLWSQMVAADIYSAFQEVPPNDKKIQQKEIGARYRNTFFSVGGCYPASEVFRRFRGRDPNPNALIKNLGLTNSINKEVIS